VLARAFVQANHVLQSPNCDHVKYRQRKLQMLESHLLPTSLIELTKISKIKKKDRFHEPMMLTLEHDHDT